MIPLMRGGSGCSMRWVGWFGTRRISTNRAGRHRFRSKREIGLRARAGIHHVDMVNGSVTYFAMYREAHRIPALAGLTCLGLFGPLAGGFRLVCPLLLESPERRTLGSVG